MPRDDAGEEAAIGCGVRLAGRMSPKRSESITAMGRAPMVKMSRRMPPTPVAAPWNGSTALGWLCDSILNATPQPSPMSMTPAFSSRPLTSTRGPVVGSFFSWMRELL
jgi:hypothetical protein